MRNIAIWLSSWNLGGQTSIIWFFLFGIGILFFAFKLVKHAEVIMINTRLGASFVGGVMIAVVTSMPELITEITQATGGTPEIGLADNLGSNAFSIVLIAIAAFFFWKTPFLNQLKSWTKITIFISLLITFLITISLAFFGDASWGSTIRIGVIPLMIFIVYLVTLAMQFKYGVKSKVTLVKTEKPNMVKTWLLFSFWAGLLIVCSLLLNSSAISFQMGFNISSESIGGIFLSVATSLPEIVAFLILLKKGQTTGALAALVGSHLFNYGISFFGDLSYSKSATFSEEPVRDLWPLAVMTLIMISCLLAHVLVMKKVKQKKYYFVFPSLIIFTYVVGWGLILYL